VSQSIRPPALVVAALLAAPLARAAAQPASPDSSAVPVSRFPTVTGRSLADRALNFPRDLGGDVNVLVIAFTRAQQADVDTWLPALHALAERHPALRYYELPTLGRSMRLIRGVIDGGMKRGIADTATRARTVTLYLDKDAFRRALAIRDERSIVVLAVTRAGDVLWRADGRHTPERDAELERVLGGR